MRRYSTESRTRKHVKRYGFLSFTRKYKEQILDTGTDALKTASKKVVCMASGFVGNKIVDAVTKKNDDKIMKPDETTRNIEEIIISLKKGDETLEQIDNSTIKIEHYKRS